MFLKFDSLWWLKRPLTLCFYVLLHSSVSVVVRFRNSLILGPKNSSCPLFWVQQELAQTLLQLMLMSPIAVQSFRCFSSSSFCFFFSPLTFSRSCPCLCFYCLLPQFSFQVHKLLFNLLVETFYSYLYNDLIILLLQRLTVMRLPLEKTS